MMKLYDEDQLLLDRLHKDSEGAFNKIYDKYWSMVYTDAFYRLKNHAQAQEITQELFIKLWTNREELQINDLKSYLKVSVRNRVLNLFEKECRYVPFEQLLLNDNYLQNDQADSVIRRNEFLEAYEALVNALPEKRKKIFKYHFEEGLSTEEITQKLQVSRKTVQNQLGRAVSSLRTDLTYLIIIAEIFFL